MQEQETHPITFFSLSHEAFKFIKSQPKVISYLACLGFFLPSIFFELILGPYSHSLVEKIQNLTGKMQAGLINTQYQSLVEDIFPFFALYLLVVLSLSSLAIHSYLLIIELVGQKNPSNPNLSLKNYLGRFSLKKTLAGFFLLLLFIVLNFERFFFAGIRIFSMFIMIAPVIFLFEQSSVWAASKKALFLRYTNAHKHTGRFACVFCLVLLGAFWSLLDTLNYFLLSFVRDTDLWLQFSNPFWTEALFSSWAGSIPILILTLTINAFWQALTFVFIACFTTLLFLRTQRTLETLV